MIHFLGQLAGASELGAACRRRPRLAASPTCRAHRAPFVAFALRRGAERVECAAFAVEYAGDVYSMPGRGDAVRVLSLLSQVIGRQKEANELPAVGTTRVIR